MDVITLPVNAVEVMPDEVKAHEATATEGVTGGLTNQQSEIRASFLAAAASRRQAQRGISELIAAEVYWLSRYMQCFDKPTNAEVGKLLKEGLASDVSAIKARIGQPNGTVHTEFHKDTENYRQYAQKYLALARWEIHAYSDPEEKALTKAFGKVARPAVTIAGRTFDSPVDALKAGNTLADVFGAFKSTIKPTEYDSLSLPQLEGVKAACASKEYIASLRTVVRMLDKEGITRRKAVPVADLGEAVLGTILGLLNTGKLDDEQLDVVLETIDKLQRPQGDDVVPAAA